MATTTRSPLNTIAQLHHEGWAKIKTGCTPATLEALAADAFEPDTAGIRCLLDLAAVHTLAQALRAELISAGVLPVGAIAIQAIAFDKTPSANWKVTWHQDVMFPFSLAVTNAGYDLPSRKNGVDYARPPPRVLETLLAVRLHLDDCDETNGPLRVAPRSHHLGILQSADIADQVAAHGALTCHANAGEALLMKPLLLHASSPATEPKHRRVLHLVYHDGTPITEYWHRQV